jgi:Putative DNA-binding domain
MTTTERQRKTSSRRVSSSGIAVPNAEPRRATLAETQALFQSALLSGDMRILDSLCDNSKTTRDVLFGVYQNAYAGRLLEILASDYEDLAVYMGETAFEAAGLAYIEAFPSRSPNARWFGQKFPEFLRSYESTAKHGDIADVAALERALSDAFDSVDAPSLTLAALATVSPEDWGKLKFAPHPSAQLLTLNSDAFGNWSEIKDGTLRRRKRGAREQTLLIWRQELTPMVRELKSEEAMMWVEAGRGTRFAELCAMVATFDAPDEAAMRAAGYLQTWLSAGLLLSADPS